MKTSFLIATTLLSCLTALPGCSSSTPAASNPDGNDGGAGASGAAGGAGNAGASGNDGDSAGSGAAGGAGNAGASGNDGDSAGSSGGPDTGVSPVAGATLTFSANGTALVMDHNVHATSTDGSKISLGGDHGEIKDGSYQTWSLFIDLANTTGPGTYKCSDNNLTVTTMPRTELTYAIPGVAGGNLNAPDLQNITGPGLPFTGDCTVVVTSWATKAGDNYVGTFGATGIMGTSGMTLEITDGVFDLTRAP